MTPGSSSRPANLTLDPGPTPGPLDLSVSQTDLAPAAGPLEPARVPLTGPLRRPCPGPALPHLLEPDEERRDEVRGVGDGERRQVRRDGGAAQRAVPQHERRVHVQREPCRAKRDAGQSIQDAKLNSLNGSGSPQLPFLSQILC